MALSLSPDTGAMFLTFLVRLTPDTGVATPRVAARLVRLLLPRVTGFVWMPEARPDALV